MLDFLTSKGNIFTGIILKNVLTEFYFITEVPRVSTKSSHTEVKLSFSKLRK